MFFYKNIKLTEHINHTVKQTFILSASNVVTRFMGMVFYIILARSISVSDYGLFRYLLTIASMYALLFIGIPTALTKFLGDKDSSPELKTEYLSNSLFLSIFAFLILTGVVYLFASYKFLLLLFIFAYMVDQYYIGFARGILDYLKLNGFKLLENALQLSILIGAYLIYKGISFNISVVFYCLSGIVSVAVFEIVKPNHKIKLNLSLIRIKEIVRYAGPVTFGAVGWTLLYGISSVYIEHYYGTEQVGYFSVGLTLMQIFSFFPDAIYTILMPKAAGLADRRKIQRPLRFAVLGCLGFSILILIPLYLFREQIITILFSAKYLPAIHIIFPLTLAQIFLTMYQIYGTAWQGFGKPGFTSTIIAIAAGINIVVGYFLIKSYGIVGASISVAISSVVAWIITILVWHRWVKRGGLETPESVEWKK
jgi:O-antigen/teichoic acid export membrane protein